METIGGKIRLKLLLRPLCQSSAETAAAEKIRKLPQVRRVEVDPERQEIEIWTGFPAEGLLRDIVGILRTFCCEVAQLTFSEAIQEIPRSGQRLG